MWVTISGKQYRDGELGIDEVLARVGEGVSTSGPAPGELAEAASRADQGDGVVLVTISKRMSSVFQAAGVAARILKGKDVAVVDSGTATGPGPGGAGRLQGRELGGTAARRCRSSQSGRRLYEAAGHPSLSRAPGPKRARPRGGRLGSEVVGPQPALRVQGWASVAVAARPWDDIGLPADGLGLGPRSRAGSRQRRRVARCCAPRAPTRNGSLDSRRGEGAHKTGDGARRLVHRRHGCPYRPGPRRACLALGRYPLARHGDCDWLYVGAGQSRLNHHAETATPAPVKSHEMPVFAARNTPTGPTKP